MAKSIAMILPNLGGGGAEMVSLILARAFRDAGHSVRFVVMQAEGSLLDTVSAEFPVHGFNITRIRDMKEPLIHHLRSHRVDAVIAHMWPLSVIGVDAAHILGIPVIAVEHGILSNQYKGKGIKHALALRGSLAKSVRRAVATVGVSDGVTKDLQALSFSRRPQRIYNPIPAPRPSNEAADRQAATLWGQTGGPRLLSVGSLKPVKNHALLLHAFALCPSDASLAILGQGSLRRELQGLASELGVSERVKFAGFRAEITPFYRAADVCVSSSEREGFGNVLVEALGNGCQVVSTDCPTGPREILAGGRFGGLTKQTPSSLAAGINSALQQPIDPEKLRQRAAEFLPDVIAQDYLKLFA